MTQNNQPAESPRPVEDWENRLVNGEGLSCKPVHDGHAARVARLRERQEAYEANLPKEPIEALNQITRTLNDCRETVSPHYAARAAIVIVRELALKGGLDDSDQINSAVLWLTSQGMDALDLIEDEVRRTRDIAQQFHPGHMPHRA